MAAKQSQTDLPEAATSKAETLAILNRNFQPRAGGKEDDSASSGAETFDVLKTPRISSQKLNKLERQSAKLIQERKRLHDRLRRKKEIVDRHGPGASDHLVGELFDILHAIEALEAKDMRHMSSLEAKLALVRDAYHDRPSQKRRENLDAINELHDTFREYVNSPDDAGSDKLHQTAKSNGVNLDNREDETKGLGPLLGSVADGLNLDCDDINKPDVEDEGSVDLGLGDKYCAASEVDLKSAKKDKKKRKHDNTIEYQTDTDVRENKKKRRRDKKDRAGDADDTSVSITQQDTPSTSGIGMSEKTKKKKEKHKNKNGDGSKKKRKSYEKADSLVENEKESQPARLSSSVILPPSQPIRDSKPVASQQMPAHSQALHAGSGNTPIRVYPPGAPASDPAYDRKWRFDLPRDFTTNLPRFSSKTFGALPSNSSPDKKLMTPNASGATKSWVMTGSTDRHRSANSVTMTIGSIPSNAVRASQGSPLEKRRPGRPKGSKTLKKSTKERVPFTGISRTPVPLPAYASFAAERPAGDLVRPVMPSARSFHGSATLPARSGRLSLGQQLERDRAVYQEERNRWFAAMNLPKLQGPNQM